MSDSPPPQSPSKPAGFFREWGWTLAVLTALLLVRSCVVNHYVVPTGSMQPTLEPGDRVLVDMRAYGWRLPFSSSPWLSVDAPKAGDVVLFFAPDNGVRLIKRVVAVEGDEVAVLEGRLYINGHPAAVDESTERVGSALVELDLRHGPGPNFGPVLVPPGKLLMVGDHRGRSLDGRSFGWVDAAAVYGRAKGVFWRSGPVWRPLEQ